MSERLMVEHSDLIVPVLCYPFPEVRELLGDLQLSETFHMSTLTVPEARELLHEGGYSFSHDLEIPTDPNGHVDFEHIHEPMTARITERNEPLLPGLADFEKQYATHGSAEAIFRLMAGWSATGKMTELGFVKSDYDGYVLEAMGLNIPIHDVPSLESMGDPVEGRIWFLSNPSAIDGNWHEDEMLQDFIAAGHNIVLDYAYGGLTPEEHPLDVSAPNIQAVLTSPSKIFGAFNHRYTGVAYTREQVGSLVSTMWFKSVPALMDTLMLYETFEPQELPRQHKEKQQIICQAISELIGQTIRPSDTILMANSDNDLPPEYGLFATGPGAYRFRLSKLFAQLELIGRNDFP
jgi:hypothetical protein